MFSVQLWHRSFQWLMLHGCNHERKEAVFVSRTSWRDHANTWLARTWNPLIPMCWYLLYLRPVGICMFARGVDTFLFPPHPPPNLITSVNQSTSTDSLYLHCILVASCHHTGCYFKCFSISKIQRLINK